MHAKGERPKKHGEVLQLAALVLEPLLVVLWQSRLQPKNNTHGVRTLGSPQLQVHQLYTTPILTACAAGIRTSTNCVVVVGPIVFLILVGQPRKMASLDRICSNRTASCSSSVQNPAYQRVALMSPKPLTHHRWPRPLGQHRQHHQPCSAASQPGTNGNAQAQLDGKAYSPTASFSVDEAKVVTKFIAETLLPTRHGKFRLRGYKHSVSRPSGKGSHARM